MESLVDLFKALADPTRVRIAVLLRRMELAVGELAQVLGQSQPRVSRHVKILADAGLLERRREGSWVFLAPLAGKLDALLDAASGEAWAAVDAEALAAVRAERAAQAQRYFALHAEGWDRERALHVCEAQVEAEMARLLGSRLGRLVDLGTGTGRILELFAERAEHAVGVDRSPEMLRLARVKLDGRGVELRQGDLGSLPLNDACADTVVIHQVLHYLPAPEAGVAEAARLLTPGGQLLIVDFAAHEREELRREAAHQRLGFADDQVTRWLGEAGLDLTHTEALGGDPLTVKLWLARRPAQLKALAA